MSALGMIFVVVVCVLMPLMAIRAARQVERLRVKPTVLEIFLSTLVTHGPIAVLGVFAARAQGIQLFPAPSFTITGWLAATVFLALATLANVWRWRVQTGAERERMSWLRPQSVSDLPAWGGIALVAGVGEEIIYRGALLGIMEQLAGGYWIAVAACVAAFALGHWVQGAGAMAIVVFFALGFHVLVRVTGDLYTAMIVHAAYDLGAGLALWLLARGPRSCPISAD